MGYSWLLAVVQGSRRSRLFTPRWSRESVLMRITYTSSQPESERACAAQSSRHDDVYWAVACNVNVNASKKPITFCPNMFGSFGGEEGRDVEQVQEEERPTRGSLNVPPYQGLGCLVWSPCIGDNLQPSIYSLKPPKCHQNATSRHMMWFHQRCQWTENRNGDIPSLKR